MRTRTVRPVSLKLCVDVEYVKSSLLLGLIPDAPTDYDDFTDEVLRAFPEKKAQESKETISLNKLDKIVQEELRMNMKESFALSSMQSLFVSYKTLSKRYRAAWILSTNEKVTVYRVLPACDLSAFEIDMKPTPTSRGTVCPKRSRASFNMP